MQARITISGNQADGYVCKVYLPREFTKRFRSANKISVAGEPLYRYWRNSNATSDLPYYEIRCDTLTEALEWAKKTTAEIQAAKKFLADLVQTEKEISIDL